MSGKPIIIGDTSLATKLKTYQTKVAPFRVPQMLKILSKFSATGEVDDYEQRFLLRCAFDVIDNANA